MRGLCSHRSGRTADDYKASYPKARTVTGFASDVSSRANGRLSVDRIGRPKRTDIKKEKAEGSR
jgi:hypothetical protein